MSYDKVLNQYDNTNHRVLMMKLSITDSFKTLIDKITPLPSTYSVGELFSFIKGDWETKCGTGNRVYDEKVYNNCKCRNMAVLFAIRVAGPDFTTKDRNHMYNCYRFIQTHPDVFGDRIRYHVKKVVYEKLTHKQKKGESQFELNIGDYDESDSSASDSNEQERGFFCDNISWACDC